MKLFAIAALTALSVSAFASGRDDGEKEFARKINLLAKMAHGKDTHKVRAEDAEEMVMKLYMKQTGEERAEAEKDFIRNAKAKDIGFGEETGWGTLSATEAAKLYGHLNSDNEDEDKNENARKIKVGQEIVKELGKMGAKFGFTSNSSGYCGIGFRGLLVIDETNEEIHEIALTPSGSC